MNNKFAQSFAFNDACRVGFCDKGSNWTSATSEGGIFTLSNLAESESKLTLNHQLITRATRGTFIADMPQPIIAKMDAKLDDATWGKFYF